MTSSTSLTRRFTPLLLIWLIAVWAVLGFLSDSLPTFARFSVALVVVVCVAWLVVHMIATRQERSWLLTVTLIAILVRITFALILNTLVSLENFPYLMGNSRGYDNRAWEWATAGGWTAPPTRFPGFEYTMGTVYRLFGPEAQSQYILLVFLGMAGGLIAPFTYKFAQQLLGQRIAQVATWIVVLLPEFVFHSSVLIRDQMTALGLSIALYGAARLLTGRTASGMIAGAIGIGMAFVYNPLFGLATLVIWVGILIAMPGRFAPSRLAPIMLIALSLGIFLSATETKILGTQTQEEFEIAVSVQELGQEIPRFGVAYFLNGTYLRDKLQSVTKTERENQYSLDTSVARGLLLGLAPSISVGGQIFWGGLMPTIPVAAYYTRVAPQIALFIRTVTWQLALPFIVYGVLTSALHGSAPRIRVVLAIAAVAIIAIPALGTIADIWDGPRYRSFGAPVLACVAALGWVRGLDRRSVWLKWMMVGIFVLNVSYLAINFIRYGSGERILSAVAGLNTVELGTSLTSLLVNDVAAIMILIIFSVCFWYLMVKISVGGRKESEAPRTPDTT